MFKGDFFEVIDIVCKNVEIFKCFGGFLIGNLWVKLINVVDFVKCGLVVEGDDLFKVVVDCLVVDGVDILYIIGGDDINIIVVDLVVYLVENNYGFIVVGLLKIIDNDVVLIC